MPFLDLTGARHSEGHALDLVLSSGICSGCPNQVHLSVIDHKAVDVRFKRACLKHTSTSLPRTLKKNFLNIES